MANLPVGITTHSRRVCSLYKRALRNIECYCNNRIVFRFKAVMLRDRFDKNANETDMRKAVKMLKDGEEELFLGQHPIPKKFPKSPGGVAYEREVIPPDWVLDYWHPLEKAQYPEYFKRREQRKKEFIAAWEAQYGKEEVKAGHH